MTNTRNKVAVALKQLSAEAAPAGVFTFWVTAADVARRAGVSEGTARRWLGGLCGDGRHSGYRGYRRRVVAGRNAYRYEQGA